MVSLPLSLPVVGKQGGRARHVLIAITILMFAILNHVTPAILDRSK